MIYTHTLNPPMSRSVKIEKEGNFSTKSPTSLLSMYAFHLYFEGDIYLSFLQRLPEVSQRRLATLNYIPGSFNASEARDILGKCTQLAVNFCLTLLHSERPKLNFCLSLLHSERPKLHRVLAVLSAIGLNNIEAEKKLQLSDLESTLIQCASVLCIC